MIETYASSDAPFEDRPVHPTTVTIECTMLMLSYGCKVHSLSTSCSNATHYAAEHRVQLTLRMPSSDMWSRCRSHLSQHSCKNCSRKQTHEPAARKPPATMGLTMYARESHPHFLLRQKAWLQDQVMPEACSTTFHEPLSPDRRCHPAIPSS